MAKSLVSLLVILDAALNYGLQRLLLFMLASILPMLGVIGLVVTFRSCFEYGRGLLELSRFETTAFVLFFLLERRFSYYSRMFGYSHWQGLVRLLSVLGVASIIVSVGALLHQRFNLLIEPILLQPLWLATYLLAMYLGSPAGLIEYVETEHADANAGEPVLKTSDMESNP